jgi:hypothetical protein
LTTERSASNPYSAIAAPETNKAAMTIAIFNIKNSLDTRQHAETQGVALA